MKTDPVVQRLNVATYRVPTDVPESDGTLQWDHTDVIVVHVTAGNATGLGWAYAAPAAASLIDGILRHAVAKVGVRHRRLLGRDAARLAQRWRAKRGLDGGGRGRYRAVGSEGEIAGYFAGRPVRGGPLVGGDLWQRRIHQLQRSTP